MSTTSPADVQAEPDNPVTPKQAGRRPLRWWPAALIVLLVGGAIAATRVVFDASDQNRVLAIQFFPLIGLLLLWAWWLFASRAPIAWRATTSAGIIGVLLLLTALLRWDGVDGDLWFQFSWRWKSKGTLAKLSPEVSSDSAPVDLTQITPDDYPQFFGPNRNGVFSGPPLARDWEANSPELLWRQPIGRGWSSFAVVGDYAITQEQRGEEELTICYELETGKERWSHGENVNYVSPVGGDGPRATPTVFEGRVYTCGGTGVLCCLDGATGELLWRHDLLAEHGTPNNGFGYSCSPLLYEGMVIVSTGGQTGPTLAAYDELDGSLIWETESKDQMGYASPEVITLGGQPQIVILNHPAVCGYDPSSGEKLWEHPWPGEESKVSQVLPWPDDRLFVSSGYGVGCGLLEINHSSENGWSAEELWHSKDLKTKFTTAVTRDGYAYGLDNGILSCVEVETGERRWKKGRYGHGQIIMVNDLLLVLGEFGEVALVEAQPESFEELTTFAAIEGKTWNIPTLAGDLLLVRNDQEAACYRLPQDATKNSK